ncbi:MAG TPA: DUF4038 domain-containing protein [Bryobacteraceae bacterium]|nr:DUF4038 domain-containing protein [Bryobacteraceae bacterium]
MQGPLATRRLISRRTFCEASAGGVFALERVARGQSMYAIANSPVEWSYNSGKHYDDPFNDVELDVVFTDPSGKEYRNPAFWAGGQTWRVRYAPPVTGTYRYRTVCSDTSNAALHGRTGTLTVESYTGKNPLNQHGPIRIANDRRHFQHSDGTPFFWLGDTWWMGLCRRLGWPDDFEILTADRMRKGFSVVQIVAGLYPDMPPFDPRGANEAGFPWEPDYARINPAYFDMADVRIAYLADHGIVPCVVGCWGYFLPLMGIPKMKQHWRNLIARWGAYPVIWCLAGEATMPFYLSKTRERDAEVQKHGWTELARYVRSVDPSRHPITLHPSRSARECVEDPSVLDFDMLQTGHSDRQSIPTTINTVTHELELTPRMPVLVGEVCYEGIMEASREEIQRYMFWACILSGAGGHTYGANGIWQVNTKEKPYGLSPHGHSWGNTPWEVAYQLPGSGQLGLAKSLLSRYPWWKLEPRPELVEPHWTKEDYWEPFAAEAPGEFAIVFVPARRTTIQFRHLQPGAYSAYLFNPSDGTTNVIGKMIPDSSGNWKAPELPIFRDWIIVLERMKPFGSA